MRKVTAFGLVLVAVLGFLGPITVAQADSEKKLTVDRRVLHSGERFTATARASSECGWILEWNGDRRHLRAKVLTATYTAPLVTKVTKIPLRGTCFPVTTTARADAERASRPAVTGSRATQRITVTVPKSWRRTIVITVLPPGSAVNPPGDGDGGDNGGGTGLPNTGGPYGWMLLAGLAAIATGAALTRRQVATAR